MREFKVVVLGPGGVGKSALTVQFISGKFVEKYDPTVEDFYRKEIEIDGDPAYLEILDTAGTEQFASMRDLYIKNGQGFIIVYSVTSRQSFQDMKLIRDQILKVKGSDRVPIVISANKCDMAKREVSTEEGLLLAQEWCVPYVETSAKNSTIVNSLFAEIVKEVNVKVSSGSGYYSSGRRKIKQSKSNNKSTGMSSQKGNSIKKSDNGDMEKKKKMALESEKTSYSSGQFKRRAKKSESLGRELRSCCFSFKKLRLNSENRFNKTARNRQEPPSYSSSSSCSIL